ncbi:MAG: hypothetical protein K2Q18_01470 [Bdellovibrionales bacterium]|nr:hypothetical protein [Bdellovibrionales bacterium]
MVIANIGLAFEWLAFFLLMGLGVYTMRVIKNEKKNYLENAQEVIFKDFILLTPRWWSLVESGSENAIVFKRLDTRYDWEARFMWNEEASDKNIIELFKEKINERQILFDEENSVIHNPSDFLDKDLIKSGQYEMVRLEGTATAERMDRLYYDAFLIRDLNRGHYLYAESKSSILNGLVEGPYFEEVILRLSRVTS